MEEFWTTTFKKHDESPFILGRCIGQNLDWGYHQGENMNLRFQIRHESKK